MKNFNGFKTTVMMLLIASIAITNVSSMHGKEFNSTMVDEVFPKTFILGVAWTTLSGSAFVGKKIFNNLAEKHPLKKEHYLKMAKRSRNVSRFSAIPLVSTTLGMIGRLLTEQFPQDSSAYQALDKASVLAMQPAMFMTFLPAAYSSGLHKATHDLPCETPQR